MTFNPIPASPVRRRFCVLINDGSGETITVLDYAIVGDRYVVRSAHGEGYWYVQVGQASLADESTVLRALFQPDPHIVFSFPDRRPRAS